MSDKEVLKYAAEGNLIVAGSEIHQTMHSSALIGNPLDEVFGLLLLEETAKKVKPLG